jgi:predicted ATPase
MMEPVSDDENKPAYTSVVLGNHEHQEGQSSGFGTAAAGSCGMDSPSHNSSEGTHIHESQVAQIEMKEQISKEQQQQQQQQQRSSKPLKLKRSSRLYGREKEQQQLLDAYRASQSTTESTGRSVVAIIKGSAGSGKTALAYSLKEQLRMDSGSMIPWTCDRQSILRIGAGFSVALRNWVDDMLSLSDKDLAEWKLRIMKPFDSFELGILVKHFPGLKSLFNADDYVTDLHQEYRYDWSTINTFMNASCSLTFPLVFLMDDFHWAEPASFRWLFESKEMENKGSFFIFTYDSDVVQDKASWWFQELQGLTTAGFDIVEICLRNLDEEATQSIVGDVLQAGNDAIAHISGWVHQQTMGNPLYVEELLHELCAREMITPDADAGTWNFQPDEALQNYGGCTTVCEYLARRLREVSRPTLEVLKVAACMGLRFDSKLVSSAMSGSAEPYLNMAKDAGILTVHDLYKDSQASTSSEKVSRSAPALQFVHNSMQEAMLRVVGGLEEQEYLHLSIGRKLILNLSDKELKDDLLTVVEQVVMGASCIKDKEKCQFAQYALEAARKAVTLSSFESAKKSIRFAVSLLHQRSWRDDYDLTLAVYDAGAEIAYASGDFEDVEHLVAEVLRGGRTFEDKLQANLTKVYALGSMNRTPEAIVLGLDLLSQLGERFPTDPRKYHVLYAIIKTRYLLHGKSDEVILRLPTMTKSRAVSAMQIMNVLFASAFFHKPILAPLLAIRMVQLSLKHGLCAASSVAFSVYGMLLVSKKSRVHEGTRMGELSFKILDRFQAKAWLPRVHAAFYGHIHAWTRPHKLAFEPLLRGYRVGLETGDIEVRT